MLYSCGVMSSVVTELKRRRSIITSGPAGALARHRQQCRAARHQAQSIIIIIYKCLFDVMKLLVLRYYESENDIKLHTIIADNMLLGLRVYRGNIAILARHQNLLLASKHYSDPP